VILPIPAPTSGYVERFDTRALGLTVIGLGGGRLRPDDEIDRQTGFSAIRPIGSTVQKGEPLAFVHAIDDAAAEWAKKEYLSCVAIGTAPVERAPTVIKLIS
jgi:thymidine phosphorylase